LRKNRHLIGLKKGSPVILVGTEGTLLEYFTWDFPVLFLILLCMRVFTLKRMKLWFSKVTGMDVSNSLKNTKLWGFSEGRVRWDGLCPSKLYLWPKGLIVLVFTKVTEDCKTS